MRGPWKQNGYTLWSDHLEEVEVRFVGRGGGPARPEPPELLAAVGQEGLRSAWAMQTHSDRVLDAAPGACGEGDALVSAERQLALAVVTADCVPVLLAGGREPSSGGRAVAAVHAGWRGLASGVIARAVERLPARGAGATAWIGPAIGACCYEVGEEVVEAVAAASGGDSGLAQPGPAGKPHLDLYEAASRQLAACGIETVLRAETCTRCQTEQLYSYRRQGAKAGRNMALIWRR